MTSPAQHELLTIAADIAIKDEHLKLADEMCAAFEAAHESTSWSAPSHAFVVTDDLYLKLQRAAGKYRRVRERSGT